METLKENYLFVLSHSELSLLEIDSYLQARNIRHKIVASSQDAAVVGCERLNPHRTARELGGSFKVCGNVLQLSLKDFSNLETLNARMQEEATFYAGLKDKISWGVSVYCEDPSYSQKLAQLLRDYFGQRLKQEGVSKAKFLEAKITGSQGKGVELRSTEFSKRERNEPLFEVVAACLGERVYVGRTAGATDHEGFRTRDFERPQQSPKLSLAPRLARLLVNLTGAVRGMTLLDPFCGTGTILQEGLMMGLNVVGIDIDLSVAKAAEMNLQWVKRQFGAPGRVRVIRGDARRLSDFLEEDSIDAVATEPILVPPLRHFPTGDEAEKMIEIAIDTYSVAFPEIVKMLRTGGRIVIVAPQVRTRDREMITFTFNEAFPELGLRLYEPSGFRVKYPVCPEAPQDQRVLRSYYVLVKS